jgi:hypothetical protein
MNYEDIYGIFLSNAVNNTRVLASCHDSASNKYRHDPHESFVGTFD